MMPIGWHINKAYYLFVGFPDLDLACAFSSRESKNMSLFYGDTRESLNNRKIFLDNLGIDYRNLACAKQIHASAVRCVFEEDRGKGALSYADSLADTDGLITDKRNLPLAVFTADCLSVFLYDPKTAAIGLIHAGWRSSREKITAKTIELMKEQFNTKAKDLYIGFGPSIRICCYEVKKEFTDLFPHELTERGGHNYLDLVRINKQQVLDLGVKDERIFDSGICTSCQNEEFFSYRKEGSNCGRIISVIMLGRRRGWQRH